MTKPPQISETPRLILREFSADDVDALEGFSPTLKPCVSIPRRSITPESKNGSPATCGATLKTAMGSGQ